MNCFGSNKKLFTLSFGNKWTYLLWLFCRHIYLKNATTTTSHKIEKFVKFVKIEILD
jgi:hypothetical protein